jgi:hypothetical protein
MIMTLLDWVEGCSDSRTPRENSRPTPLKHLRFILSQGMISLLPNASLEFSWTIFYTSNVTVALMEVLFTLPNGACMSDRDTFDIVPPLGDPV